MFRAVCSTVNNSSVARFTLWGMSQDCPAVDRVSVEPYHSETAFLIAGL